MSKLKHIILGMLIGMFIPCTAVFAQSQIKLIVNGQTVQGEAQPQILNGKLYVPARALAEALGANVAWNAQENTVTISSNGVKQTAISNSVTQNEPSNIEPSKTEGYVVIDDISEKLKAKGYGFMLIENNKIHLILNDKEIIQANIDSKILNRKRCISQSDYDKYVAPVLQ